MRETGTNILEHGNDYHSRVYQAGYPRKTRDKDGVWTLEERFYIHADNVDAEIPGTRERKENLPINNVEINSGIHGFPDIREVVLTWKDDGGDWNGASNNKDITIRSQTQYTERDIEDHPLWGSIASDDDKEMLKHYRPKFGIVSVIYIVTESRKKANYKWYEEELIGDMYQNKVPPYLKNAVAKNWKCIGREITWTKKQYVEITDTWQYDFYEWEGTITPFMSAASLNKLIAKLRPLWQKKKQGK